MAERERASHTNKVEDKQKHAQSKNGKSQTQTHQASDLEFRYGRERASHTNKVVDKQKHEQKTTETAAF